MVKKMRCRELEARSVPLTATVEVLLMELGIRESNSDDKGQSLAF